MTAENGNGETGDICRDYQRGVCNRKTCKFAHPADLKVEHEMKFCHDFQNGMCNRNTCKFYHATKEEEDYYNETGNLPPGIEHRGPDFKLPGRGGNFFGGDDSGGGIPICKDFTKGECHRGTSCKYRHMSRGDMEHEERMRRQRMLGGPPGRGPMGRPRFPPPPPIPDYNASEYEHERYRRWMAMARAEGYNGGHFPGAGMKKKEEKSAGMRELEEENAALRRKNEELRKTIQDLTSTNDVLLEQNARLRALRAEATTAGLQSQIPKTTASDNFLY